MAFRVLGQAAGAGALAPLYTVPANTQTVTSTLLLLNTGSDDATVRVTVAPAGAADTAKHTVLSYVVSAGDRLAVQEGWTLAASDVVRFNAPAAILAHLFGSESAA